VSLASQLAQKNEEVAIKQANLARLFDGVTDLTGQAAIDRRDAIKSANDELTALGTERDELDRMKAIQDSVEDAIKAGRHPNGPRQAMPDSAEPGSDEAAIKTLSSMLRGNERYQDAVKSGRKFRGTLGEIAFDAIKATSTTADMVGPNQRLPLLLDAQESRTVADLMLQGTTSAATLEYYEETTFTNAAAEVAEGGTKPEGAVDFTLITEPVRKIATWIPVTDEMMADNEGFESYLRGRLEFMIKQREELQLLVGDGTAPNISGIHDRSGVQTQAKGADPVPDAIFKAITKVRNTGFAEPTAVVMHPNDWQDVRLLRTADGIYIWGSPADAGPERIWGLPVRVTSNETENTALVGAFRPDAQIFRRGGVELAVSDSHASYFISNLLAVRAEERIALAVYRPASFCKVTGI
jgi:HK97 family phage major capsid protein